MSRKTITPTVSGQNAFYLDAKGFTVDASTTEVAACLLEVAKHVPENMLRECLPEQYDGLSYIIRQLRKSIIVEYDVHNGSWK